MTTDVVLDTAATTGTLPVNATLIGTIDAVPESGSFNTLLDHDWYALSLVAGHSYWFSLSPFSFSPPATLNDVALDVRDANRNILNTQGVVDSGVNGTAGFFFVAPTTGTYYADVSAGGSNPASLTGDYEFSVLDVGVHAPDTILDTPATDASLVMNGTVAGTIDLIPASGSFNTSADHDWYAVTLTAGHKYSFTASDTTQNGLYDFAIELRDANRNIVDSQGVVDSPVVSKITYAPAISGTYYLDIGPGTEQVGLGVTPPYTITATDLTATSPDTALDTPSTTASLIMNGTVSGTIDPAPEIGSFNNAVDHDWYAVSLTAGERYTFSAPGTGIGILPEVAISLMNANRTVVDSQGVVDGGTGASTITFTAPTTGTYYLDVSAGGKNAVNATGGYQITTTDNGPGHLVINLVPDASVTAEFGANYQSSAFWTGIEAAANFFATNFFDPISVTIDVGWGEIDGFAVPSGEANSEQNQTKFTFGQIVAALAKDVTSANDAMAVAHLPIQDPGPGGTDFQIADAEAKALGLSSNVPAQDGFIGFATDWDPTDPSFVGVVEHEISEVLGRGSGIDASTGFFSGLYSVLDLFRYSAGTAEPSSATGPGGSTYFSIDGGATALNTFSSTASEDPGGDWAPGGANDAFNAILPSGPAPVSAADLTEMDVLGYDRQPRPIPVTMGGIDYRVPANGGTPTSYIGAGAIAAGGYQFAIEYIGTASNAGYLRASDSAALVQQGLSIVSVYSRTGLSDKNADGSYNNAWVSYFNDNGALGQGTADAIDAINAAKAAGQTSGAIYFAVNLDPTDPRSGITQAAAVAEIDEYFREINTYFTQVGAPYSIGVYGAGATLSALQADASSGVKYTWLSDTWLNEVGAVASKNLEQTDTSGSAMVGGQSVDLDTAYTTDFGQWNMATSVIESNGSTSLVQVDSNYFLFANGTTIGPELKFQNAPVTIGQFNPWTPIAAEITATGYEVAWKNTSTGQFSVWKTDGNGNYAGDTIHIANANDPALEAIESTFQQDLNGDGTLIIEASGATSLTQVGSNYFLYANGTTTGPELKMQNSPVFAGQFSPWTPIAAEQTAGGYVVALKNTSTGQFSVWNTDLNGNYAGDAVHIASANDPALEAIEASFNQDLNGDGAIGTPGTRVIESFGATSLTQVGNNYFLYANGTTAGPELKMQNSPVSFGQLGPWTPVGAEQTANGYEVALRNTSTGQFSVWNTDLNGNYAGDAIHIASAGDPALEAIEGSFQQDLNGDGTIVLESSGATSLTQVGSNYFLYANGTTTGPELKMQNSPVFAGQFSPWTPIGAEQTASGYEVALKNTSTGQFSVWNTDLNGNYAGDAIHIANASDPALEAIETSFHQDLNGDGTIGSPGTTVGSTTIESFGSTSLTQVGSNYFLYANGTTIGPELKMQNSAVSFGQFSPWTPIGAEQTASGYEVAWQNTSTGQFSVWNTDGNGNYAGDAIHIASASDPALEAIEVSFHQDLNGDRTTGVPGSGGASIQVTNGVVTGGDTLTIVNSGTVGNAGIIVTGVNPVDLPDIAYGDSPTLLYTENNTLSGGILAVTDSTHTDDVTLFGQYTETAFTLAPDNGSGTLVYYPPGDAVSSPILSGSLITSGTIATATPASASPVSGVVALTSAPISAAPIAPITLAPVGAPDQSIGASLALHPGQ